MNILDENIIENQRRQLLGWRISVRQIGFEIGRKGMKDREIISLLHQSNQATFFTRDDDFYDRRLCHPGYCLVYLDVSREEAAFFTRRVLRQQAYKTKNKRMGKVIRASHVGLSVWYFHAETEAYFDWDK